MIERGPSSSSESHKGNTIPSSLRQDATALGRVSILDDGVDSLHVQSVAQVDAGERLDSEVVLDTADNLYVGVLDVHVLGLVSTLYSSLLLHIHERA